MNKMQGIVFLFILLIVILSMKSIFYVNESFINGTSLGYIGSQLNKPMNAKPNLYNGNIGYESLKYIGLVNGPSKYRINSDDHPLSYGFPSFNN